MSSDGGSWALEQMTKDDPNVERVEVRRCYQEVREVWHGTEDDHWWRWCLETMASVGVNLKVVDCLPKEAAELARHGACLATRITEEDDHDDWLVIFGSSRKSIRSVRFSNPAESVSHTPRQLRRRINETLGDEPTRYVVSDPGRPAWERATSAGSAKKPLQRLQRLLSPEWSDIWIVIVFAFVVGLFALASPIAVEALVNTVAFGRFLQPVIVLAIILFTFLGFSAAMRALQTYVVEIIQQRLFARVAADLSFRLPRVRLEKCEQHYLPELVNRFFDIITVQKVSAQLLLDGVALTLTTVIGMTVLGFYHPWLFGFDLFLFAAIVFLITVLGRGAIPSAIKESKMKYLMAGWLEDVARCPATFRSDGGIDFAMERADHLIKDYLSARQKHFRVLIRQILFVLGLQAVASTALLGLGGWLVISGELTLGQLVAAELIVTMIVGAFSKLGKHMESYYDLLASIDKLGILFDLPSERDDGLLVLKDPAPLEVVATSASYYRESGKTIVDELTFHLPAGESLAIFGPAGSGKSTILDLLYALRNPKSGHLTVGGFDPGDLRPDLLRRRVAMVRGLEIFGGTIAENVHLHRPEVSANDLRDVLEKVGLLEDVLRLEESLETELTSGGNPLSENQCRLLSIARAMAGRPGLLLLDGVLDALSDVEVATVLDALTDPEAHWTLIVATGHRGIADRCDQTYHLEPDLEPQSIN